MSELDWVDRGLARDEMGTPCRSCLEDWGHCRCVADCGALQCLGWADTPEKLEAAGELP